jgi:hypothetical protein
MSWGCRGRTDVQFEAKYAKGIAEGSQTLTFRRWKTPQAIAGNTYRTAAGRIEVTSVQVVAPESITDAEARLAGHANAAALVADLRGTPDLPVYRVGIQPAKGPDPRDQLAASGALSADERDALTAKLARLDRASPSGPWTGATLALIASNRAVRAGDLAPQLGQELLAFKLNVRKLKNLGLTISLGTGYRLSPRGEAYLRGA